MSAQGKADGDTPANVDDHDFVAPEGQPWGLCQHTGCNLSEAAHTRVPHPYSEHMKQTYGERHA